QLSVDFQTDDGLKFHRKPQIPGPKSQIPTSCLWTWVLGYGVWDLHTRARGLDGRVHVRLERLEVLDKHARQVLRLLVVGLGVRPRAARTEHAVGDAGACRRNVEVEDIVLMVADV